MAGGSMAYYLLKLFSSRPARWLDRVVIGAFVAAPAMAHVEIAKRRWVGCLAPPSVLRRGAWGWRSCGKGGYGRLQLYCLCIGGGWVSGPMAVDG